MTNEDEPRRKSAVGHSTMMRVIDRVRSVERGRFRRFLALLFVLFVISGVTLATIYVRDRRALEESTRADQDRLRDEMRSGSAASPDFEAVKRSVARVALIAEITDDEGRTYFPPLSTGSCFAWVRPGFLVTNRHVTESRNSIPRLDGESGERRVYVFFAGDEAPWPAELVWESEAYDMAVLAIERPAWEPMDHRETADIAEGEAVWTCGFPSAGDPPAARARRDIREFTSPSSAFREQELVHSFTSGIVSAIKRTRRPEEKADYRQIQTDADINPGNSGGPLLTADGRAVGIATWKRADASGIAYAVALDEVAGEIEEKIEGWRRGAER